MAKINNTLYQYVTSILASLFFVTGILAAPSVYATPMTNTVTQGLINVKQSEHHTVIEQNSSKAIIEWESFNIGPNEHVEIKQPPGGILLIRVQPNQGTSRIEGQLSATGKVIFVNQAGVYFSPTAQVQIGA